MILLKSILIIFIFQIIFSPTVQTNFLSMNSRSYLQFFNYYSNNQSQPYHKSNDQPYYQSNLQLNSRSTNERSKQSSNLLVDQNDLKLDINQFTNLPSSTLNHRLIGSTISSTNNLLNLNNRKMKKDLVLEDALKTKCLMNIIYSLTHLRFVDVVWIRRNQIRTQWYKRNEQVCRSLLQFDFQARFTRTITPGLIELKLYKLKLVYLLVKWKFESIVKLNVWLLVIVARVKQAILGRHVIRDEDINLLIHLFYPELFNSTH